MFVLRAKEQLVARDGLHEARAARDPDGLAVSLVPRGQRGITSAGIVVGVRDVEAQERFLIEGMGARPHEGGRRVGDTQLFVEEDPISGPATPTCRRGFVYVTLIVNDCVAAHEALVAACAPHSHSSDCLYYIVEDGIVMGRRELGPGDGFFLPAEQAYAYHSGPNGVKQLEFRHEDAFDMKVYEKDMAHFRAKAMESMASPK